MNRREFLRTAVVTSAMVATGLLSVSELVQRLETSGIPPQQSIPGSLTQQIQQETTPAGYVFLAPLSSLAGKSYAYFSHPSHGNSILISDSGTWKAFSATCTHQPCTVGYGGGSTIGCPCHGAVFNINDGSVLRGPAILPLPEYSVLVLNGDVYVSMNAVN